MLDYRIFKLYPEISQASHRRNNVRAAVPSELQKQYRGSLIHFALRSAALMHDLEKPSWTTSYKMIRRHVEKCGITDLHLDLVWIIVWTCELAN